MVVASAKDRSTRKPLFPVAWDNEVLLVPAVRKQRKPVFTSDEVSKIVGRASGQYKVMFVVLAASGLRISELLGLQIENVLDDCYRLRIVEKNYNGKQEDRLKTLSAERIVELHSSVAGCCGAISANGQTVGYLKPRSTNRTARGTSSSGICTRSCSVTRQRPE